MLALSILLYKFLLDWTVGGLYSTVSFVDVAAVILFLVLLFCAARVCTSTLLLLYFCYTSTIG